LKPRILSANHTVPGCALLIKVAQLLQLFVQLAFGCILKYQVHFLLQEAWAMGSVKGPQGLEELLQS